MSAKPCQGAVCLRTGFPAWILLLAIFIVGECLAAEIKPSRTVLPNGLTVVTLDQPSLPIITVNVMVKAGAVHDPDTLAGLSSMVAQMLDEGTKTRTSTQIAQQIEFIGSELAFAGTEDFTTGTLRVLRKNVDLGFTLLADALLHPVFPEREVERVRSQVLGELQGEREQPGIIAGKAFDTIVFQGHPYRRPANGTEKTVSHISRKDLMEFHRAYYHPNSAIIAIVGDIRNNEALELVKKYFGAWAQKNPPSDHFSPPASLTHSTLKVIDKDLTQANIILGHVGIERKNPDFYAVSVMNYILGGGGFSSRLVNRIRDELGLVYDVDSGFQANVMPGPFTVRLQTRNAAAKQAIMSVIEEIKRIRTEPVSDQELADAKAYLVGSFPLRLDTTVKLAALLTLIELHGLGLSYFDDYPKAIIAVTKEDVLRVAQKYLHPDAYALVVVAKEAEAKISPEIVQ
ncbi:MAG: insulinase family protein [Nitrospirae bacterium]|nr:MAG: insulinase family protein [Nitrospirota bacterium]